MPTVLRALLEERCVIAVLETTSMQVRGEGTSSELIQAGLGSLAEAREEPVSGAG